MYCSMKNFPSSPYATFNVKEWNKIVKNNILRSTYELLEKMGRLSPKNLKLNTAELTYEKDYEAVKKIWLGFEG